MKVISFQELMDEQANAAVRISGAHHSSWNGKLRPLDRHRNTGGIAAWDHAIEYNPRIVDEPLKEMFGNSRVHNQDPDTLRSYRAALKVVLHENVHMLASDGRDHAQAQHDFADKGGVRALEESITEIYSQQRLNDYIDELGLNEIAPGIENARSNPVYKQYLPAAEAFTETIGQRSRVGGDEVIRQLAVVPADQKFRAAAEIIYDNSELRDLVPSDQRAASIERIAEAMRPSFAQIDKLDEKAPDRQRRIIGGRAAREGYSALEAMRKQWVQPAPQLRLDRSRQSQQERQPEQGHQSQSHRSDQQGPAVPQSPELQNAMRAGMSGTTQITSAKRLSADQQGSRRSGGGAHEPQRPQHEI